MNKIFIKGIGEVPTVEEANRMYVEETFVDFENVRELALKELNKYKCENCEEAEVEHKGDWCDNCNLPEKGSIN